MTVTEAEHNRREWGRDLGQVRELVEAAVRTDRSDADGAALVRDRLSDAVTLLEHLVFYRGPLALGVSPGTPSEPPSVGSEPTGIAPTDMALQAVLTQLATHLQAPAPPSSAGLQSLSDETLPLGHRALQLAVLLERGLDPLSAWADDKAVEDAVPRTIRSHPQARSLTRCPTCNGVLGELDRTLTGSYCERCRTRWETAPEGR